MTEREIALELRVKELEEALKIYANPKNWELQHYDYNASAFPLFLYGGVDNNNKTVNNERLGGEAATRALEKPTPAPQASPDGAYSNILKLAALAAKYANSAGFNAAQVIELIDDIRLADMGLTQSERDLLERVLKEGE